VVVFLRWPRRATGDHEEHARQHGSAHNECDAEPDVGFGDREKWASWQDAVPYSTGINGDARNRESTDGTTEEDKDREPDQHASLHTTSLRSARESVRRHRADRTTVGPGSACCWSRPAGSDCFGEPRTILGEPPGSFVGLRAMRRSAALLLVVSVSLLACESGSPPNRELATPSAAASAEPWSEYPVGWSRFPTPPEQRSGDTWVWAGSELLLAGGCDPEEMEDRCRKTRTVYAFDPAIGSWESVQPSLSPMADADAVWTGAEAIFLETGGEEGPIVGEAYEPSSDTWRSIGQAPISQAYGAVLVWTGDELIVWGGGDRDDSRTSEGAVYDPTSNSWRRIADAPIGLNLASGIWTGREMIVFGSLLSHANRAPSSTSLGEAYDPTTDTWRELPASALSPQATSAALVDDRMVAWDYEVHSQTYNPITDHWSEPQRMPFGGSECYPDSTVVTGLLFAWFCGKAALFDGATSTWQRVAGGPLDETIYSKAYKSNVHVWRFADLVAAGPVVVMPMEGITLNNRGIACYGCPGSPTTFWVYRPVDETVPT
jgi:hypothetical protein